MNNVGKFTDTVIESSVDIVELEKLFLLKMPFVFSSLW